MASIGKNSHNILSITAFTGSMRTNYQGKQSRAQQLQILKQFSYVDQAWRVYKQFIKFKRTPIGGMLFILSKKIKG